MGKLVAAAFGFAWLAIGPASAQVTQVQLSYNTYAAGLEVMQMHAFFGLGPWNYQVDVDYHTTGLVGLFYHGRQVNTVRGLWQNNEAIPSEFFGEGVWHGRPRRTLIDYVHGLPEVRELQPPQDSERESVPQALQLHTVDTLSALAQLIRQVGMKNSCDTEVHTYDGRRVLELTARTRGNELLPRTSRSVYAGPALRCDFEGRELAGFLIGDDDKEARKPLHGSAWLAPMLPGTPALPVQIAFETHWFGIATMYLTQATPVGASPPHLAPGD